MLKYRVIKRGHLKIVQDELNPLKWGINTLEDAIRFVASMSTRMEKIRGGDP